MKYILLVSIFVSFTSATFSQPLMEMVKAEQDFAAYAGSTGIAEAFVKFLSDSAKVFERGQILNGKDVWRDRKTDSMDLRWYPEFAEVAASGDFGYTTGPSEFRLKKGSEKADHKGYFNSIWKKDSSGEWKVLLDIGTPSPESVYDESKIEYTLTKKSEGQTGKHSDVTRDDIIKNLEEQFAKDHGSGSGYAKHAMQRTRYYRPGAVVAKGSLPSNDTLQFKLAGTGIAPSGDMGYAYGYVEAGSKAGNYLRVWKKDTKVWRIVLDAATY